MGQMIRGTYVLVILWRNLGSQEMFQVGQLRTMLTSIYTICSSEDKAMETAKKNIMMKMELRVFLVHTTQ